MKFTQLEVQRGAAITQVKLDWELEDALWKALRYDFGRHSATTGDVAKGLLPEHNDFRAPVCFMSNRFLEGVARDIEGFLENRQRVIEANDGKPLGVEVYEHDVKPYEDLLVVIKEELKSRR